MRVIGDRWSDLTACCHRFVSTRIRDMDDVSVLRPHIVIRDLVFRYFTYYDEPHRLRPLLERLQPIDASVITGDRALQLPTTLQGAIVFNAHDFVASATKDVFRVCAPSVREVWQQHTVTRCVATDQQ